MKVKILLPEGKGASNFYRAKGPADVLIEREGMDIDYSTSRVDVLMRGGEIYEVDVDADVVVFPRPAQKINLGIAKALQRQGIAVVAELDDDFQAILPSHVSWREFQPHLNDKFNWKYTMQFCNVADLVVGTTPSLVEKYAKHGRGMVVQNFVPEYFLDVEVEQDDVIGWAGNTGMHPGDLEDTSGAVWSVMKDTGVDFRHLGKGGVATPLGIKNKDRITHIDWVPYEDYATEVAKFRTGIVPLGDNKFNESKSWLKGLEYAALGVPFVASPTTEYRRLSNLGIGVVAKNYSKWYSHLKRLQESPAFREELRLAGREEAANLTMEKNAWQFAEAWEEAINQRKN